MLSALLLLLVTASAVSAQSKQRPPNFIIILADDLGYGDLGSYGHPTIETPYLDQLAQEGTRFTQFYVAASVCSPSRAALLTGRLPVRTGITGGLGVFFPHSATGLPHTEITIAKALQQKGYHTGIVGKWHLGSLPDYLPTHYGFDEYFGIPYSNDMEPNNAAHIPYPALPLYKGNKVIEENPDQRLLTQRYTTAAVDFIKSNKDKPFFLYYPNNAPHVPLFASPAFAGKSKRGQYGDVVQEFDWSVGQIVKTLKELKLDNNTFVLFLSDNGPWLTQHENGGSAGLLRDGKSSAWEGGTRVPAIAWWPGTIPPRVSTAITSSLDILPTLLHQAGATVPADKPIDGVDITAVLTGKNDTVRTIIYYYDSDKLYAIRKGSWKAHFSTHSGYSPQPPQQHATPLLYNIENDPSEKEDVSSSHSDIVAALQQLYTAQLAAAPVAPSELSRFQPGELNNAFQQFIQKRKEQAASAAPATK
ncbi:arylsulfatase [Filimonas lacunae]|uniref:Arylsulfatase n=2 Tax=Filimonas lacunae TaxID=477680 RepID=A0A173MIL8_9BACT|nr:sulfatase [Filimonas lacunae]BAV07261.1 arylsulfatase [Filimonas lacunae]SIS92368.1 arylsulfatase [Filimonas lacunae]